MRFVVPVVLAVASVPAQTYVVDALNGPGANFTQIAAAIPAVPDGAVLLVRPGHYASFAITGKSLTILGGVGVTFGETFAGNIGIDALAPGQRVVVHGLQPLLGDPVAVATVTCNACQGEVLLDAIAWGPPGGVALEVNQCAQVFVTNCTFGGNPVPYGARFVASDVTVVDTNLGGGFAGTSGLVQVGGRVHFAGVHVTGVGSFSTGGPAVSMQGGALRIDSVSSLVGGLTPLPTGNGRAIDGTGSVRYHPGTVMQGAIPVIAPTIAAVPIALPVLHATGGQIGAPATATLEAIGGTFAFLLLGLPGPAVTFPGLSDPLSVWNAALVAYGVMAPPLTAVVNVPSVPALVGQTFVWQGLAINANGTWNPSNAVWFVLR